jgi:selenocysteine lyase/cysteine desulfurase
MNIPNLTVYSPTDGTPATAVVSCRTQRKHVSEVGLELDEAHGILSRVGLHCAPAAHRTIGTFPEGTVRLAPGFMTSRQDIDAVIGALEKVTGSHG